MTREKAAVDKKTARTSGKKALTQPVDSRRRIFYFMLAFSVILEIWVRFIMPFTHGQNGFYVWSPVDNIMHFFWGVNIFLFLVLFRKWTPKEGILGIFGWQMVWEVIEMVGDIVTQQPVHMADHLFFDGTKDTIVDLAGGLLGWWIITKTREGVSGTTEHRWASRYLTTLVWLVLPLVPVGAYFFFARGYSADILASAWIVTAAFGALLIVKE